MRRQLILSLGVVFLLLGWLSGFLIRTLPQVHDYYYLVPTLLLCCGMGIVLKLLGGRMTAIVLAMTAIVAVVGMNQLYPSHKVSFANFQRRLVQQAKVGTPVAVVIAEKDRSGVFAESLELEAFADVSVRLFAQLPGPPRLLLFAPDGSLFVSLPQLDAIYQLRDLNQDGFADRSSLFHFDLDRPHGLAWRDGKLYVAETARVLELQDRDRDGQADQVREVVTGLPDDGGHWTRSLVIGSDGFLYVSIGSRCNACDEDDPRRATVLRVDPATGAAETYATGLRNTVGLAFSPDGSRLWGSDNGRDMLGDDLPPDEINQLVAGGDYGWPYCFGRQLPDSELGAGDRCPSTVAAAVDLPAHSAPLGIAFGDKLSAPDKFRNSLYVALHGSWNRSVPTGYKLIRIPFADGQPSGSGKEFLSGWLKHDEAWGRPVAPAVGPDGNLYLTDDRANAIYRISWNRQE